MVKVGMVVPCVLNVGYMKISWLSFFSARAPTPWVYFRVWMGALALGVYATMVLQPLNERAMAVTAARVFADLPRCCRSWLMGSGRGPGCSYEPRLLAAA